MIDAAARSVEDQAPRRPDAKAAARVAALSGPIVPTLLGMAIPTITVLVAQTAVGVAETYYVSYLGTDALVGVSVVFPVWMLMTMMSAGGLGGGVASAVARAIGSGRDKDADELVHHAVALACLLGLAFALAIWLFGQPLFEGLGAHGAALVKSRAYAGWLFLGAVPIWIVNLCSAALRGAGNVKTPAMVTLVGALVLIPLSPFFIFGLGPFHGFGVAGAGIAVTTYSTLASLVLLRYLARGRSGLRFRMGALRWPVFRDVLGVGLIASLGAVQLNLAVILVTAAMGHFGTAALAGYGIASRLDYLLIPILFGLGSAVLTMVGTCVGAGDIGRAKRITLAGALIGMGFTEIIGLVAAVSPPLWVNLFSHAPDVVAAGATYLHVVAPFYAAMAITFVIGFASQGSGRPLWPTLAGTVRLAIAAGLGWIAVALWRVDMHGLSLIVAAGQAVSAAVCVAALMFGLVWPRSRQA